MKQTNRKLKSIWEDMEWRPVDVSKENLGEFDDSVFFSLEELDPQQYTIQKGPSGVEVKKSLENDVSSYKQSINNKNDIKLKREQKKKTIRELRKAAASGKSIEINTNISSTIAAATVEAEEKNELSPEIEPFFDEKWGNSLLGKDGISLHSLLKSTLLELAFQQPTPIQRSAIPMVLRGGCDLVGCAETGSGKTLAFGLPVLHRLMWGWNEEMGHDCPFALVLAPTRELAMQIGTVFRSITKSVTFSTAFRIEVVTVVGGMSEHKQRRQLGEKKPVHILVATPGRLCELLTAGDVPALSNLSSIRFLVVDEVDRMIEEGHFPELQKIFGAVREHEKIALTGRVPTEVKREALQGVDEVHADDGGGGGVDVSSDADTLFEPSMFPVPEMAMDKSEYDASQPEIGEVNNYDEDVDNDFTMANKASEVPRSTPITRISRQTLLFSATALGSINATTTTNNKNKKRKRASNTSNTLPGSNALPPAMKDLLASIGVQKRVEVVDVTSLGKPVSEADMSMKSGQGKALPGPPAVAGVASTLPNGLQQMQAVVPAEEKDVIAYYFLTKYPGRTLVFVNSIKVARRLDGLLRALGLPCRALHAQQQQKQRLKALEAFRDAPRSILVATDVAARGLDVPSVQSVLHYDVARSPQLYVHRSGRTARAGKAGLAVSLVTPEDASAHEAVCASQGVRGLKPLPVQLGDIPPLRERVSLAKKIFTQSFVESQQSKQSSWLKQTAAEMGLEPDEELLAEEETSRRRGTDKGRVLASDRRRLRQLLEVPIHSDPQLHQAGMPRRKKAFIVVAR